MSNMLENNDTNKQLPQYIFDKIIGYSDLKKTDYYNRIKLKKSSRLGLIDVTNAFMGTVLAEKWHYKLMEAKLRNNWNSIIGENIANYAIIKSLKDKILVLNVENSTWATTIKLGKNELIAKINKCFEIELVQNIKIVSTQNEQSQIRKFYRYNRRK